MERELNRKVKTRKEKEKDCQVKILLENMTPRINYSAPFSNCYSGLRILLTNRKRYESPESLDQIKREQSLQRIIYQRDSEILSHP
jgi:hypothetical protein